MASETSAESQVEIGHVLFIDIVGYSKRLVNEQSALVQRLNRIVRSTEQFRKADEAGKLITIPTGDGMALVFFTAPDAPIRSAMEINKADQEDPKIELRMGIHSGPVDRVIDVTERANVAGAGINMAQRVMDCADAGHILLSKRAADDLAQYDEWKPQLHDLGEMEVKHGVRVPIVNFFNDEIGNAAVPSKLTRAHELDRAAAKTAARQKRRRILAPIGLLGLVVLLVGLGTWAWHRRVALASAYRTGVAGIVEKSIAVLPFDNFDDKENAYFADGVQDDILTDLAKVADLKVISRRSVAQYRGSTQSVRDIGQALQVAYVLEGTVRKVAGKLRVTAQLIDTRTEAEKWGEKYERDVADVFAIQNQISQTIVAQLKAALSPAEKSVLETRPTQDQEAYDLYLRARALIHQGPGTTVKMAQADIPRAITLLETAVARDPNFTLAYCLLSEAQLTLFHGEFYNYDRLPKAKMAADAALRINPQSGEAHLALAAYLHDATHDSEAAAKELAVAAASLPGNVDVLSVGAEIAQERGQWRHALQQRRKALDLDPRDAETALGLIELEIDLRWYADAEKMIEQIMSFLPQQMTGPFWTSKGRIALAKGDTKGAMAAYDAHPRRNAGSVTVNNSIADVLFLKRQYDKAKEVLQSTEDVARQHNAFPQGGDNAAAQGSRFLRLGTIARLTGETQMARTYFETARPLLEAWLAKNPQQATIFEARSLAKIAVVDAALGRKDQAIRELQHVLELWPLTRNAVIAADIAPVIASGYLWAGEHGSALRLLEQFANAPYGPTAGDLKLNPVWDELRSDSRFAGIVAEASKPIDLDHLPNSSAKQ